MNAQCNHCTLLSPHHQHWRPPRNAAKPPTPYPLRSLPFSSSPLPGGKPKNHATFLTSATRSPAEPPAPCFLACDRLPAPTPPPLRARLILFSYPAGKPPFHTSQSTAHPACIPPASAANPPPAEPTRGTRRVNHAPAPAEPTPAPSTRAGCRLSLLPRGTRARSPPPRRLPAPPHPMRAS